MANNNGSIGEVIAYESNNGNHNINPNLDYFDSFPPGYRFCPKDDELVVYYLKKKVRNEPLPPNKITEVNVYKHSPEQLAEKYKFLGEKQEWYFFTPRDRKYRNGSRPNRTAGDGYWKATGADKGINFKGDTVGYRKALVYYIGKPPKGEKTDWLMQEYRVNDPPRNRTGANDMRLDEWVLCRIYKKANKSIKTQQRGEEYMMPDEFQNELMQVLDFDNDDFIDSTGFTHTHTNFQRPLQIGLPEIPQISDVSIDDDFFKFSNPFQAMTPNYGIFEKTAEPLCIGHPPQLHCTTINNFSRFNNHLQAGSLNYGISERMAEPVCIEPPPPLHSTGIGDFSKFNDHLQVGSLNYGISERMAEPVCIEPPPSLHSTGIGYFSKFNDHLQAGSLNYGISERMAEPVCIEPPPPLHSTGIGDFSKFNDHLQAGSLNYGISERMAEPVFIGQNQCVLGEENIWNIINLDNDNLVPELNFYNNGYMEPVLKTNLR